MAAKANTVNIKSSGEYHHGDLRAAALSLALSHLNEQEHPELGLRSLARELGVSATALYRHFPSKDALLDALAMEGLAQLGASQAAVAAKAQDGTAAFRATGAAYVDWALANPALFRLTFSRLGRPDLSAEAGEPNEARRQLMDGIAAVLPPGANEADRAIAAAHAWSLVHGLSHLILDGQVAYDKRKVAGIIAKTFGLDRSS